MALRIATRCIEFTLAVSARLMRVKHRPLLARAPVAGSLLRAGAPQGLE